MLLSFYDTFLNDSLIDDEKYDINSINSSSDFMSYRNSPGIMNDVIVDPNDNRNYLYPYNMDPDDYFQYMRTIEEESLHAKLICLRQEKHQFLDTNDRDHMYGTNLYIRRVLLDDYLTYECGLDNNTDYSIDFVSYDNYWSNGSTIVRNYIIDKIEEGYPVLIGVSNTHEGHALIAYDYDEETDKIYCNFGWNAYDTHKTIEEEGYTIYKTAMTIDFNMMHSHSNNYGVRQSNGDVKFYCYNAHDINTYDSINNIEHTYNYRFQRYNISKHKAFCSCGLHELHFHNYDDQIPYVQNHYTYVDCKECGYSLQMGMAL